MADIVDLSSLIRSDDTLVDVGSLEGNSADADVSVGNGDLVELGASEEGLLHFGVPGKEDARVKFDRSLDWSNQELADLYRVQRLLGQAGIGVDTDRGVSDEGDPWFVFLDAHGEVFVHLSRIDGTYILDSVVQEQVVIGHCFATLIERFAGRAEAAAAVRPDGANVVSMNRRGKVVLHPGAALAALVWSILLVSDELVFLESVDAPETAPEGDAVADADATGTQDGDPEPVLANAEASAFEELFVNKDEAAAFLADAATTRDGEKGTPADLRDSAMVSANAANSATMAGIGLTALAAAYGINRGQSRDDTARDDDQDVLAAEATETDGTTPNPVETDVVVQATAEREAAAGKAFDADAEFTDTAEKIDEGSDTQQLASGALDESVMLASALGVDAQLGAQDSGAPADATGDAEAGAAHIVSKRPAPEAADDSADAGRNAAAGPESATRIAQLLETVGLSDLLDTDSAPFISGSNRSVETSDEFFRLLDDAILVVSASNAEATGVDALLVDSDLSGADGVGVSAGGVAQGPLVSDLAPPKPILEFAEFTDDVRNYIDHLILTSEVEVIELDDQIVLIDTKALSEGGEAFALTWSLDEETTVSTIGVRSDFEAFDLIA